MGEARKPAPDEVRNRVRRLHTADLLLIVGGFGDVEISGPAPAPAVARLEALVDEASKELERRGIEVAGGTGMVTRMMYVGDAGREAR